MIGILKFAQLGPLLFLAAVGLLTAACHPQLTGSAQEDIVHSLSVPGIQFRRVAPLTTKPVTKKVQNHLTLTKVPSRKLPLTHRNAVTLFGQVQQEHGGYGYENVSVINRYAVSYAVEAKFNGASLSLVLDAASSDTWLTGKAL
jgi:hypothetical protein